MELGSTMDHDPALAEPLTVTDPEDEPGSTRLGVVMLPRRTMFPSLSSVRALAMLRMG